MIPERNRYRKLKEESACIFLKTTNIYFMTLTWHISFKVYTNISKLLRFVGYVVRIGDEKPVQRRKSSRTSTRWQQDYSETQVGYKHQQKDAAVLRRQQPMTTTSVIHQSIHMWEILKRTVIFTLRLTSGTSGKCSYALVRNIWSFCFNSNTSLLLVAHSSHWNYKFITVILYIF